MKLIKEGKNVWTSPRASVLPDRKEYLPDILASQSASFAVLIRGLPAAIDLSFLDAGQFTLKPQLAPHLVHTGMIARSLIAVADALDKTTPNSQLASVTPNEFRTAAKAALLAHDDEMRVRSGQTWYVTPPDFPGRRLNLDLPHNHIVDAATTFLSLGKREADDGLYCLGESLTQRFLTEINAYEVGTLRHPWFYYPVDSDTFAGVHRDEPFAERRVPPVPRTEDSSHATMRVRALAEWKGIAPELVPDASLSRIAFSFRRHFLSSDDGVVTVRWLPGDERSAARRGYTNTYPGAWGVLAPWDPTLKRRINAMAHLHPPKAIFGATVLSSAEIVALNST